MRQGRVIPLLLRQPADGTPYRPSNGTEGDYFTSGVCEHCKRDDYFRHHGGWERGVGGCDILARSYWDENGAPEWQWQNGEPTCTAFDDLDIQITNEERAAQLSLELA